MLLKPNKMRSPLTFGVTSAITNTKNIQKGIRMKKIITNSLKGLLLVPALAFVLGFASLPMTQSASATDQTSTTPTIKDGAQSAQGNGQSSCLFSDDQCQGSESAPVFKTITNVLLFIVGAISVIMLIIGGIRYTVSGGDSTAVTSAKNTILYAVIGIIVSLLAFAVVNFVIGSFMTP